MMYTVSRSGKALLGVGANLWERALIPALFGGASSAAYVGVVYDTEGAGE